MLRGGKFEQIFRNRCAQGPILGHLGLDRARRQLKELRSQVAALTAQRVAESASDASDEENAAPTKATKRSVRLKSLKR